MTELILLGISHKTAPVALREKLALPGPQLPAFLQGLVAEPAIQEAVAISTCNRTEVYLVASDAVAGESGRSGRWPRAPGSAPPSWPRSSTRRATATPPASSSASSAASSR